MDGTIQNYTLDMAADTKKDPLEIKQYDTNSRWARISLVAFKSPWIIPFGCQIHISVRKTDGTLANATCTRETESTVLAPITDQMAAVAGTHLGELYFLGNDGDIRSQTFPVVVRDAVTDLDRLASSDDFQVLKDALREVKTSTEAADIAAQYATEQGNSARDGAQRANDAADSIQVAVDAAANAKACESNAKNSELAAAQTQQEVTDYVEAQKAAFVGYSQRESDSKYANALTETATGEGDITVEDAWTAPVLGLDVAGKSEQVVTTGAQLLDSSKIVIGGLSGDKGAEFETQARVRTGYIFVTEGDVYKLSGYAPYVVHNAFVYGADKTMTGTYNIGSAVPQNAAYARISLKKSDEGNFTVDDLATLKKSLMFNAGSAILPYEPYTGGAPSPSPDYPQDIISTGTVSTGAQMLNVDTIAQGMISTETGAESESSVFVRSDYIPVKPGDYILSGDGLKPYFNHVMYFNQEKVIQSSLAIKPTNGKFTVADETAYIRIRFISKDGTSGTVTPSEVAALKPMLNAGDTALSWEPYTGGKPSPSAEYPQPLEVRATGRNLYDTTKTATAIHNGTISKIENDEIYFTANGSDPYFGDVTNAGTKHSSYLGQIQPLMGATRISLIPTNKWFDKNYFIFWNADAVSLGFISASSGAVDVPKDAVGFTIRCGHTTSSTESQSTKIQVQYESESMDYEPYKGHQTANITLTEPLRGIVDYRDRIMCRDGVWGIECLFKEVILTGQENWATYGTSSSGKSRFYADDYIEYLKPEKNTKTPINMKSDRLLGKCSNDVYMCKEGISSSVNSRLYIYLEEFSSLDVDTFKTYLSTHPISVIFELNTPTWEPLPTATQQALNELTTYAGTTHLTITAGGPAPTVTLDYVQDTHKALEQCQEAAKEYTDTQIAAIVAALPTATQAAIVDNQTTRLLQEV